MRFNSLNCGIADKNMKTKKIEEANCEDYLNRMLVSKKNKNIEEFKNAKNLFSECLIIIKNLRPPLYQKYEQYLSTEFDD